MKAVDNSAVRAIIHQSRIYTIVHCILTRDEWDLGNGNYHPAMIPDIFPKVSRFRQNYKGIVYIGATEKVAQFIVNPRFEQIPSVATGVANGIGLKPYPCCRNAHRPLDAMLALVQTHQFAPDAVERIECEISAHVTKVMTYPKANTRLEGKFSLPYCLAVSVCDQRVGIRQFADARVSDPQVQALSGRVSIILIR